MRLLSCCAAAIAAVVTGGCALTSESPSAATPPLAGTSWRLLSINGRPALADVTITAAFGDDQRVTGSAGCNRYVGSAAADGARLAIGLLASTRMHCGDDVMPQEAAYLSALEKARSYRVVGDELRLGPDADSVTLVFQRD